MGGKPEVVIEESAGAKKVKVPIVARRAGLVQKSRTVWFNIASIGALLFLPFTAELSKIWINDPMLLGKVEKTITLTVGLLNAVVNLYLRIYKTSNPLKFK